jgi:hypothetical protein
MWASTQIRVWVILSMQVLKKDYVAAGLCCIQLFLNSSHQDQALRHLEHAKVCPYLQSILTNMVLQSPSKVLSKLSILFLSFLLPFFFGFFHVFPCSWITLYPSFWASLCLRYFGLPSLVGFVKLASIMAHFSFTAGLVTEAHYVNLNIYLHKQEVIESFLLLMKM